jgi:hypothetical protein
MLPSRAIVLSRYFYFVKSGSCLSWVDQNQEPHSGAVTRKPKSSTCSGNDTKQHGSAISGAASRRQLPDLLSRDLSGRFYTAPLLSPKAIH